jgi:hypothetical protein
LQSRSRVKKTYILIHIEDISVAEAFDILGNVNDLLEILILSIVEDRIVDYDSVNLGVRICCKDSILNVVARDFTKSITESTREA